MFWRFCQRSRGRYFVKIGLSCQGDGRTQGTGLGFMKWECGSGDIPVTGDMTFGQAGFCACDEVPELLMMEELCRMAQKMTGRFYPDTWNLTGAQ